MNEAKPRRKDVVFATQGSTEKSCYLTKVKIVFYTSSTAHAVPLPPLGKAIVVQTSDNHFW